MKKITKTQLKTFLRKHKLWLADDPKGEKADLREADLREADLYGADLREANLYGADLRGADLYGADLREADLRVANLYGANLYEADLREADLRVADLYGADLREANLYGADLYGADLREANLYGADLRGANLYGADICGADICCPIACPEEGAFIGFKKVRGLYIVKLLILEDSLRSSATTRKCRCNKAKVLSITTVAGKTTDVHSVRSDYDKNFRYEVGKTVSVDNFDTNRWNECAPGIHFFITRQEAVDYQI